MRTLTVLWTLISVRAASATLPGPCRFTPLIQAQVGDNVTLQCCFNDSFNLQKRTVDWKVPARKQVVHVYRNGGDDPDPQAPKYRDRTALNREDLARGAVTLQIFSVQLDDSDDYVCNVPKGPTSVITLKVRERLQSTMEVDSKTTRSAEEKETKTPDAEKMSDLSIVGASLGVLLVLILGGGLALLLKLGKIQDWWRNLKENKPAVETANSDQAEDEKHLRDGEQNHNT